MFDDDIDIDLNALSYLPSALLFQGAGPSGELEGENSGETPQ